MKVIVCGDRDWKDYYAIKSELSKLPKKTVIIHGAARGADRFAKRAAEKLGLKVRGYPANWVRYRKGAGPIRNRQMLHDETPKRVIAFHNDLWNSSKGTRDMVLIAIQAGVRVDLYSNGSLHEDIDYE